MKFSYMSKSARWTFGLLIMAFLTLLTERIIMAREGGGHGLHVPHSWADWTILPAVILMLASILLTQHEISDHAIILRQGILIRCFIPLDNVAGVRETSARPLGLGVRVGPSRTLFVNTALSPLLSIELRAPQRFWLLFVIPLWEMRRIVINVREPEAFLDYVCRRIPPGERREMFGELC